jgi:hypothetical protein
MTSKPVAYSWAEAGTEKSRIVTVQIHPMKLIEDVILPFIMSPSENDQ